MSLTHNTTVEDSSPLIVSATVLLPLLGGVSERGWKQYTGIWADSPPNVPDFSQYSGYAAPDFASFHVTNSSGSTFTLSFNGRQPSLPCQVERLRTFGLGTAVYVFGTVGPTGGPFSTTLSSTNSPGNTTTGNSQASATAHQALLYSGAQLDNSVNHVLTVNVGSGEFILDYVVVESPVPGSFKGPMTNWTLDDTSPAFSYSGGTWQSELPQSTNNTLYPHILNGTSQSSDDVGAQARIDFNGTGVVSEIPSAV